MNKLYKKGFLFLNCALILTLVITLINPHIFSRARDVHTNNTNINISTEFSKVARDTSISVDSNGILHISRNKRSNEVVMGQDNSWTLFIYLTGTNLESQYGYASEDIKEILNANFNSDNMNNLNIIIQTGGSKLWHTDYILNNKIQRFKVDTSDRKLILLEEYDNQSMGDYNTLYSFLDWGVTNYASEHMGVIFWDHGSGVSNGLCNDENYNNESLSVHELEYTFAKLNQKMTSRFELIGFDTCLSGSLEYANLLAPYAKYMVASADLEPGEGWHYTEPLNYLLSNPDATGSDLGKVICDSYANYMETLSANLNRNLTYTIATYDLSKVDKACIETNYLTKFLYEKITSSQKEYWTFADFRSSRLRYNMDNLDIGSILDFFETTKVYDYNTYFYRQAINDFIIYNRICSKYKQRNAIGVTLYLPYSIITMNQLNTYRNICFSPYWFSFIEWANIRAMSKTMDHYVSCNWESSPYFFEDTFDFINYDQIGTLGFDINSKTYNVLISNTNYDENGFPRIWYSNILNSKRKPNEEHIVPSTKLRCFNKTTTNVYIDKDYMSTVDNIYNSIFTYMDDDLVNLGQNNQITYDKQSGFISSTFENTWFMLPDGQLLTTYIISQDDTETIYAFPVMIGDEESSIRISETIDATGEKNFSLLGVWDTSSHRYTADKFARGYLPLTKGTVITPIYDVFNIENDTYETIYGEEYTIKSVFDFLLTDLSPGDYLHAYEISNLDTSYDYTELNKFTIKKD